MKPASLNKPNHTAPIMIDVKPQYLALIRRILQQNIPEQRVWAFGSRVCGTAKNYSDLDLMIDNTEILPQKIRSQLLDDFGESNLPWKVDMVEAARLSHEFRQIIDRHKILIQSPAQAPSQAII
ncbi:MAG: nucleotidyltransferase domain-containing protein [Candidatus Symbiobacter sp.]|nr:nucleotidyltransferase domain-containing protein [Candidatus Symbiobacter sp.]